MWNAPGEPQWVADKMSGILNYLLRVGPIVRDGESFGEEPGDRSIRGFFGTTKAQRYDPTVKVLMLEFDAPGAAKPRPDELPPERPAEPATSPASGDPPVDLISLVVLTRPTTFPSNIIREMLERAFPSTTWTIVPGSGTTPHLIEGSGDEGKVVAFVSAYGLTIPPDLLPPPHRLHLMVHVGTHGDLALARRVSLVLCSCLIISLDKDAHFQLSADGNWLSHDDALTGVSVPCHTKDIGDFDRVFGTAPEQFRDAVNPADAYPPAPDDHFKLYRPIGASGGRAVGAGQRRALDEKRPPDPPPATPRPIFGRKLFGRRGE